MCVCVCVCVCLFKKMGSRKWERSVCVCVCVCVLRKNWAQKSGRELKIEKTGKVADKENRR